MNRVLRGKRWILFAAALVVFLTVGAVAFWYRRSVSFKYPFTRTEQGVLFEELLPDTTFLAASVRPSDPTQYEKFTTLWNVLLQDKVGALSAFLLSELRATYPNTFAPEDFLLALQEPKNLMIALAGDEQSKRPNVYVFYETKNPDAAARVVEKISTSPNQQKIQFGIVKDVVIVTNAGSDEIAAIKSRYSRPLTHSLARDGIFRSSLAEIKEPFGGYFYINMKADGMASLLPNANNAEDLKALRFSVGTFSAETDGMRIEAASMGDKKRIEKSPLASFVKKSDASLYKVIPEVGVMFYGEMHHFADFAAVELQALSPLMGFTPEEFFEGLRETTGFDFNVDLRPFLEKGFAVSLHDTGTILPALSFFVDASGTPQQAQAVIASLDKNVPQWVSLGNIALQAPEQNPVFTQEKFSETEHGRTVKIYTARIPAKIADIAVFKEMQAPVEISYGLTNNNVLFFSMIPDIKGMLGKGPSIEANSFFVDAKKLLASPASIVLVNGNAIGAYSARLVEFARTQKKFSPQEEIGFEVLRKYLSPLRGYVQMSQGDGVNIVSKGLFKIQPAAQP